MEVKRFFTFINRIDAIHKFVLQIRGKLGVETEMKGVHTMWVYLLSEYPDGLTLSEIAELCSVDRSLVSREIAYLSKHGIAEVHEENGRRVYNSNVRLTEKGLSLAMEISRQALSVQKMVDVGITEDELNIFYSVVDRMCANFAQIEIEERG